MGQHAKYAPSAAHRWINCPASLNSWTGEEGESSHAAEQGTAAHELFTHALQDGVDPWEQHIEGATYNGFPVDAEMAETIGNVVTALRKRIEKEGPDAEVTVAEVVQISNVHKTDCWGELDFSIYTPSRKRLYICDLKYGVGTFVTAKENWQMLLYADGKCSDLEMLGEAVETIIMAISQPRNTKHRYLFDLWEIKRAELEPFIRRARAATKDHETLRAGKWCKFCPNKLGCDVYSAYIAEGLPERVGRSTFEDNLAKLTPEKVAKILEREADAMAWFALIRNHAQSLLKLGGKDMEQRMGWRMRQIVGHRKWKDIKDAEKELHTLYGDVIYESRQLLSPAQMDKIKGAKPTVKKHTERPITGETLEKIEDDTGISEPDGSAE